MKFNLKQLPILALLILALFAAACGGADQEQVVEPTPEPVEEVMEEEMEEEMDESMEEEMDEEMMEEEMDESMEEEMDESMEEEMDEEMSDEEMDESMDEEMDEEMSDEEMDESMDEEMDEEMMDEEMMDITSATPAADLRIALTNLLGEHVLLASSATNAALDGRTEDFEAAAALLDENTLALGEAIGSVYGDDAEEAFVPLWRNHIGFFVDYTNGVAADDQAMQDQAIEDLLGYRADFIAFLNSANPEFTEEALAPALTPHVETLTAVIDAQAAEDHEAAYEALREAYGHMSMIAVALADGIAVQMELEGHATSSAADLRTALNTLLAEHTYLASMATNAALDGRDAEFEAAAATLDNNTLDLGAAIGSVYGEDAEEAFVPLWRNHIGFFVDYTLGVAGDDQAMKDQAIEDLLGYRADFIAFLNSANPELTEEALSPALTPHVETLTSVIEAQGADQPVEAFTGLREAYAHMQVIADALAESIVQQFPENFQ